MRQQIVTIIISKFELIISKLRLSVRLSEILQNKGTLSMLSIYTWYNAAKNT